MLRAAALALASLLLAAPAQSQAPTEGPWHRVRVIDGDTVELLTGFGAGARIRVLGIDTPELRGACPTETAMARAAADRMRSLTADRVRVVTFMEADRYERLLARLYDRRGREIAAVLIAEGLARPLGPREARRPWC